MKSKLIFASVVTLGILASFVFFVFYLIAFQANLINFGLLVGLTVLTNVVLWLISPYITDLMQKWFYRIRRVDFEGFTLEHPEVAAFVREVCRRNNIPLPSLRVIEDNNPTAYCYGSFPANARLVVSEGIFKYLNVEEQKAVYGHELGHIVNLDFIVMTVATTLLQILYEVYYNFLRRKRRSSGKKTLLRLSEWLLMRFILLAHIWFFIYPGPENIWLTGLARRRHKTRIAFPWL